MTGGASPVQPVLETIDALDALAARSMGIIRREVAPAFGGVPRLPLIPGTEGFAGHWLPDYHGRDTGWIMHDIACYSLLGARVSGAGNVWWQDRLVTAPAVMPDYVADALAAAAGGNPQLWTEARLPIRHIDAPCLIATGHGTGVYGHFLVEMLFRVLVARAAFAGTGLNFRTLLPVRSPQWLLDILEQHLQIPRSAILFYDPAQEQVALRHAILPTQILQPGGFHPGANAMIDQLIHRLDLDRVAPTPARVFAVRRGFYNPAAPYRVCMNEDRLAEIAAQRHGFAAVAAETLSWREQAALFHRADIVLGLAGSGLHNAIFARPGSRLASLGVMNAVQSDIGTLRLQHNAFLMPGVAVSGQFTIDEDLFTAFLDAVCAWPGAVA